MGYTVSVNHPHFPEGTIFNVGGLDRVPNGSSLEVDEEMERLYMMEHGQTVEDGFKNDAIIDISGSSALDQSEIDAILEAFAPVPEVAPEEATTQQEESPAWLQQEPPAEGGEVNA